MLRKCVLLRLAMLASIAGVGFTPTFHADLKYEETSKITGGMMEGMAKVMGAFGAKGLNNSSSTHFIKGDRMRTDHIMNNELARSEIIDVGKEEFIHIDHKKKTYTVMTFEQMRQQMQKAMESMQQRRGAKDASDVKMEPKFSVKDTGETKVINGYQARHFVLTFILETQDQKTKNQGSMAMDSDLWVSKDIKGFEEQKQFYMKMAQKMGSLQMFGATSMGQDPRMGQGLEALKKETEKLDGAPVLTVANFKMAGTATDSGQQPQQPPQQRQSSDSQSSVKEDRMPSLGKVLGGLGGFGRKKKKADEPQQSGTPESQPPASTGQSSASMNLMSVTTELKAASNAGLDSSLFEVPKGYKLSRGE